MTETERVLSLPDWTARPATPTMQAAYGGSATKLGEAPNEVHLRPHQAQALRYWRWLLDAKETPWGPPGLAVLAGCGTGKTLIELLLPSVVGAPGYGWTLYLVPARLKTQLLADREAWAAKGLPIQAIHVQSHEALSARSGKDLLETYRPDHIVIDEAHRFADVTSGRWRRVAQYLADRQGKCRLSVFSGSLARRGLRDYSHLLVASLRAFAPCPVSDEVESWAACLDPNSEPHPLDRAKVAPLLEWSGEETVRGAFLRRLRTAPGVVLTENTGVAASLTVSLWEPPSIPVEIEEALTTLVRRWETPDGTEVASASEFARLVHTLSLGAYTRYVEGTYRREWADARNAWLRAARSLVEFQGFRFQTMGDVVEAALAGTLAPRYQILWHQWQLVADSVAAPEVETVWLDDVDTWHRRLFHTWNSEGKGGRPLVWTRTPEVGKAFADNVGVEYHGAGSAPPTGAPAVVSMLVHGVGWNTAPARGYSRGLVLEPFSSGDRWEQLLSRLHRPEQTEDVEFAVLALDPTRDVTRRAMTRAVTEARYALETTGADQRLLEANWDGMIVNRVEQSF